MHAADRDQTICFVAAILILFAAIAHADVAKPLGCIRRV
jgi:hypothetical protein